MKEPEIREVKPPSVEPILKVGIVIEEDAFKSIKIKLDTSSYKIDAAPEISFRSQELSFSLADGLIACSALSQRVPSLVISVDGKARTEPGRGISVSPVRAGRGFHWSKDIEAVFSGSIEIIAAQNRLIVVNHVELEDYLASVISSEMSAACPTEFAKAQAIAARSWVLVFLGHKHEGLPYTICNDDCCQRYQGTTHMSLSTLQAIQACRGQVLVSRSGVVCPAYYSKSCGGRTDTIQNILNLSGGELVGIFDGPGSAPLLNSESTFAQFLENPPTCFCSEHTVERGKLANYLGKVDEDGSYFRWNFSLPKTAMVEIFNRINLDSPINRIDDIEFGRRSESGRLLQAQLKVQKVSGEIDHVTLKNQFEIRQILYPSFLYSSAFIIEGQSKESLDVFGAGWGHGVGLCQIGALGMALRGESASAILTHYYPRYQLAQSY
jgi:peptidoglycan hydrolase-like amidase